MNQKTQRLATIRKIIRSELVGSQEELIARLAECGIEITQSTLSRDLKFMNVAKVPHKNKGYIYVLPNTAQHDVNISSNISDNITSLTFSGNLGVLKTKAGYASAISVPIDNLDCPNIIGTIAGDNTVLIILREEANRNQVIESLMRIFPMLGNVI
ncbi:MAG: ArgR family transcriptional regulator [Alistipes sp.]|nr:ArgR family transcriptional regulator [Alistipes sp.]MBO5331775.1 ArgR family transcriptional regulator [Alistipes sp.]MBP3601685.1 ArgR family transcriptional regulator [Alistipes sp.]MBQ3212057.1 ArgR family transcriptional regulator [Alistipes sp.]MBQ7787168.1 ArgR family transcriptional regulator [Alistipes sp.]